MSTKTDNIEKLKKLRVYGKWKANVLRLRKRTDVNRLLSDYDDFEDLILSSFDHIRTPEGCDFWQQVAKR